MPANDNTQHEQNRNALRLRILEGLSRSDGESLQISQQLQGYTKFVQRIEDLKADRDELEQLQIIAGAITSFLLDPGSRSDAIDIIGLKPHQYRGITLNDRPGVHEDVKEALGPITEYFHKLFFKLMRYEGHYTTSRLEYEARRIHHFERFNQGVEEKRGISSYVEVPLVLSIRSRNGLSAIAEERIRGECLYEHLSKMEQEMLGQRCKDGRQQKSVAFTRFLLDTVERIVHAQAAALSLDDRLIEETHHESGDIISDHWDDGAFENARLYKQKIFDKVIGVETTDEHGFPGGLSVVLDPHDPDERELRRRLIQLVGDRETERGIYFPIAYVLGDQDPGIDSDRSLWNILIDEEKGTRPMVDFETIRNSPHAVALASATAQGVYLHNRKETVRQKLDLEGEVIYNPGATITTRDLLRLHYMRLWNQEIRANAEQGLYGNKIDIERHLLTDYERFRLGHTAAGVQRALVHFATFIKIMHNMILDEDRQGYALARRGMEMSLTHANDSLQEFRGLIQNRPDIVESVYTHGTPKKYRDGLGSLIGTIRDIRHYLKRYDIRRDLPNRILQRCYQR